MNSFFKFHRVNGCLALSCIKGCCVFLALITVSGAISGCGGSQNSDFDDYQSNSQYEENYDNYMYEDFDFDALEANTELWSEELMSKAVSFDETETEAFKSFLRTISVSYPHEDLYNIDAVFEKYSSSKDYVSNSENIFTGNSITAEKLFEIVKENNNELSEKGVIEDSKLKEICSMVCKVINDYLENGKDIDYSLLSEKISKLKIEKFQEFAYGYYDQGTNTLGVDVESSERKVGLDRFVYHETYHLIQSITPHDNIEYQHGFCRKFKDESVNSLNLTWFYEGAAEYLTLNHFNAKDSDVYPSLINSFDTIKVATVLTPDKGITDFEKLSLSPDLDGLFEYFNCADQSDRKEILKMMFAFELNLDLNYTSSSREFYQKHADIDILSLKPKLTGSIAQTLSKQFYRQLIALPEYSVKDIFSLISIFENEISRLTWYNSNREAMGDFFEAYNMIQGEYFRLLADKAGVSPETVIDSYNLFNHKTQVNSHEIASLSAEKQEFFDYIVTTRQNDKMESVNIVSKR